MDYDAGGMFDYVSWLGPLYSNFLFLFLLGISRLLCSLVFILRVTTFALGVKIDRNSLVYFSIF